MLSSLAPVICTNRSLAPGLTVKKHAVLKNNIQINIPSGSEQEHLQVTHFHPITLTCIKPERRKCVPPSQTWICQCTSGNKKNVLYSIRMKRSLWSLLCGKLGIARSFQQWELEKSQDSSAVIIRIHASNGGYRRISSAGSKNVSGTKPF